MSVVDVSGRVEHPITQKHGGAAPHAGDFLELHQKALECFFLFFGFFCLAFQPQGKSSSTDSFDMRKRRRTVGLEHKQDMGREDANMKRGSDS